MCDDTYFLSKSRIYSFVAGANGAEVGLQVDGWDDELCPLENNSSTASQRAARVRGVRETTHPVRRRRLR